MAAFRKVSGKLLAYASSRNIAANNVARGRSSLAIMYEQFGDPEHVLKLQEISLQSKLEDNEIEVDMLCVPVNPSDINQIQGTYPIKSELPGIGGNEGVGVVRRCGLNVIGMKEGDWVIPIQPGVGTWRTSLILKFDNFLKVSSSVPVEFAATLQVNPPTAYRMLKDFVNLRPGDTVIQNGANSAVGQAVIQLAAAWGVNTINVVRSRPESTDFDVVKYLKDIGATEVVTEEYLHSHQMKELMKDYPKPSLGLNCVGGKSSTGLIKVLKEKGILVTYGGMSRQPVTIATSSFIFKDISCVGYWNGMWLIRNKDKRHLIEDMFNELCTLGANGKLVAPRSTQHALNDYINAINNAMKPFVSCKQLLLM